VSFESALRSGSNVPLPRIVVQDDWDLAQLVEARENVEQRAAVLDREIGDIVGQLERAAWREANGQGLIEPSWFVKASDALRHRRRELKQMQKSLDEINYSKATRGNAEIAKLALNWNGECNNGQEHKLCYRFASDARGICTARLKDPQH
jgi:hypothetical protein